jgi:short-subunit dehydrogenase
MSTRFYDQVVFVTGASSGIGEALAEAFAEEGAQLVLAARRVDRLKSLAEKIEQKGLKALPVACDVTKDGDLENAAKTARENFGKIDIVVANAGFGVAGKFAKLTLEDYRRQFETNVFGVLRTLYATLEDIKKSKGIFVILGSVSGYVSAPEISPYSMSKYAIRALAEALQVELRSFGISVVLISPGFIQSEIRQVNNQGVFNPEQKEGVPLWMQMSAEKAARKILNAVARRKREAVITFHGKLTLFLQNYCPWLIRWVFRTFASKGVIQRNRKPQES